jgi:hypothetical protein
LTEVFLRQAGNPHAFSRQKATSIHCAFPDSYPSTIEASNDEDLLGAELADFGVRNR